MESPDKSGKKFDTPWVLEDVLHISNIHTELIAESTLHFKWNFSQAAMHCGDSLVTDSELWEIGILEESIVWLFLLRTESFGDTLICTESASFSSRLQSFLEELDVSSELMLDCLLNILGSGHILDLHTLTMGFLSVDRNVDVHSELTLVNVGI